MGQWPNQNGKKVVGELESRGVAPEIIRAIASLGPAHFGMEPVTDMDKMLFAYDEVSGFVHTYSLIRPDGYKGMELKGVKKRLKGKAFAANINRDEISSAASRAGIESDPLITYIITTQIADLP